MKNSTIKSLKASNGITLIALVITIIVLLILAGIAISMLSGDNSVLKKATEAKGLTEVAGIEEEIKLEYLGLLSGKLGTNSGEATVEQAIKNVKAMDQYKDKIVIKSEGGGTQTLSSNSVIVGKNDTATITIETGKSTGGDYYAFVDGKYYKIQTNNEDVRISRTPTEFNDDDSSSSSGGPTGVSGYNSSVATASLSEDKKTITIEGIAAGTTTVSIDGTSLSASIEVVDSVKTADMDLDGAMLLTPTTTNNTGMTSGNEKIATITNEGVVMCGEEDGDVVIKTSSTQAYKVHSTAKIVKEIQTTTQTFDGQAVGTYNNPTIPAGFYAINTKDAEWKKSDTGANVVSSNVDNGLVIMDDKGNQFVWVPVQYINDMVMCTSKTNSATDQCDIETFTDTTDNNKVKLRCKTHSNSTDIVGKLYATSTGESFDKDLKTQKYTQNSGLREPDTVNYDSQDEYKDLIDDIDTMKTEYKNMALSVAKYGGFYVGRYESSMPGTVSRQIAGANSMTAGRTSQKKWYGLYAKQKEFSTEYVTSYMIWGSQYDAMMNWMAKDTSITVTSSSPKAGVTRNTSRITGATKKGNTAINDKLKNVYDLLGNSLEWTMEAYDAFNRVIRGGSYDFYYSPSYRNFYGPGYTSDRCGSRPSLYVE